MNKRRHSASQRWKLRRRRVLAHRVEALESEMRLMASELAILQWNYCKLLVVLSHVRALRA